VKRPDAVLANVKEGSKFIKYCPCFIKFNVEDLCKLSRQMVLKYFGYSRLTAVALTDMLTPLRVLRMREYKALRSAKGCFFLSWRCHV